MVRIASWGAYIHRTRCERDITRRELAKLAGVDPSYITLIERDGYVPKRPVVENLAKALGVLASDCMVEAGYSDAHVTTIYKARTVNTVASLHSSLKLQIERLARMPAAEQKRLAHAINSLLRVASA